MWTLAKNTNNLFEDNFTAIFNLTDDPMIIINTTGNLLTANISFKKATGCTLQELVGKNLQQMKFLDKENKAILAKNFKKRINGIDVEPYEIKITTKNGHAKYFETKGKRIIYKGKPVDFVIFHDITQRRHVQEKLELSLHDTLTI